MQHERPGDTPWLRAACVAGGYLVAVATLFTLRLGSAMALPVPVALAAPALVYAGLSVVVVPQGPGARRLAWLGGACVTHAVLAVLAAAELMWAGALPPVAALANAFVRFAPAPVLTVVATSLILLFVWERLTPFAAPSERPAPRSSAGAPAPPSRSFTRTPALRPRQIPPGSSAFAMPPARTIAPAPPPRAAADATTVSSAPHGLAAEPAPPASAPAPAPPLPRRNAAKASPAPAATEDVDGAVRISFERVAAQLPADAFVLPLDRLGESLKEPHVLLVPRQMVLARMREGGVSIRWPAVATQFPELALRMSEAEFRDRYPDLELSLPIDEVLAQLPPDRRAVAAAVLRAERPDLPPSVPSPARSAGPAAWPSPAGSSRSTAPVAILPGDPARVPPEMLARILARFEGLGTLQASVESVGTTPLVTLVEPGISRAGVVACAGAVMRFGARAAEVITVRTARAVVVMAGGSTTSLVAGRRIGATAALLELRVAAAATELGPGDRVVAAPSRLLQPLGVDARVTGAREALRSFDGVAPAVFGDGDMRVYVFSAEAGDGAALGAQALDLVDALGGVTGELGRLVSITFRRGGDRMLVRPLAGAAVLAAAGPVSRPGRIHRDAERAVARLEAV